MDTPQEAYEEIARLIEEGCTSGILSCDGINTSNAITKAEREG